MTLRQSATGRTRLGKLGEDKLLAQILPHLAHSRRVIIPAGDDCALVRFRDARDLLVLKSDCVVEGVHFTSETRGSAVGWKAMMRALSDFAAMAALPEFALITLIIWQNRPVSWVREFYRGLNSAAKRFSVAVVGGETSSTSGNTAVTVSLAGHVEPGRFILRSGGKVNDDLFVTGELGGSIGGRHLKFIPRIAEARWLARHFAIHAMIDLSDGLGADLPRMARASKVGFEIDQTALPRARGCTVEQAISDGEDYELLFAISPRHRRRLATSWKKQFPNLRLTRIGKLIPPSGPSRTGIFRLPPSFRGYVHFQKRG